jgi:pyruvate dehydrogenase E1 component
MYADNENVFYYITVLNENYAHPAMPAGVEEGICKGMYLLQEAKASKSKSEGKAKGKKAPRVQLLGSGSILREVLAAAELLQQDFGVVADVWSVPSFTELRREGIETERWNRLHPTEKPRTSYVEECLGKRPGPVIASTDYMRAYADQIRPFIPGRYVTLGTDGYGRSDLRGRLRSFFEVDRNHVTVAALKALADEGTIPAETVAKAIESYEIETERAEPWKL